MKKRGVILCILSAFIICIFAGCAMAGQTVPNYEQITPEEAKAFMENETGYVILDVRTEEEFAEGHIKNAVLIPDYEIAEKAESVLTDKKQLILVYCRSGRRSKLASEELVKMGYSNVKEFGGIIDWPYEIVTDFAHNKADG